MKKLKPHAVDWAQIDRFLASADKKLASARKILAFDEEACLQQAYEAMLKASLGFNVQPWIPCEKSAWPGQSMPPRADRLLVFRQLTLSGTHNPRRSEPGPAVQVAAIKAQVP
jgi:hypothetical protein